jgi:glycosyltransferase involved in cell wall biosynthesis
VNQNTKYAGIEHLVWEYSKELSANGHKVSVMGHAESKFPTGVLLLSTKTTNDYFDDEVYNYQTYMPLIKSYDVIHDFSHMHLPAVLSSDLPSLNIFWHSPCYAQYKKAPYNIVALSVWAENEYYKYYGQKALYQQTIGIDTSIYHPEGDRTDRWLSIGRMSEEKGNLNAIKLCLELGLNLDVCGGRGAGNNNPLSEYEKEIMRLCDGKQIVFKGEVSDDDKIKIMRSCRGLIYCTEHLEVTNHKLQEAMLCGAPVIAPNTGGQPEIVTHGINGYLCDTWDSYKEAIKNVDKLNPESALSNLVERYDIKNVVKNYVPLYEKVANGLRWK